MKLHRNVPVMVLFRMSRKNMIPFIALVTMATKLKKIEIFEHLVRRQIWYVALPEGSLSSSSSYSPGGLI